MLLDNFEIILVRDYCVYILQNFNFKGYELLYLIDDNNILEIKNCKIKF